MSNIYDKYFVDTTTKVTSMIWYDLPVAKAVTNFPFRRENSQNSRVELLYVKVDQHNSQPTIYTGKESRPDRSSGRGSCEGIGQEFNRKLHEGLHQLRRQRSQRDVQAAEGDRPPEQAGSS